MPIIQYTSFDASPFGQALNNLLKRLEEILKKQPGDHGHDIKTSASQYNQVFTLLETLKFAKKNLVPLFDNGVEFGLFSATLSNPVCVTNLINFVLDKGNSANPGDQINKQVIAIAEKHLNSVKNDKDWNQNKLKSIKTTLINEIAEVKSSLKGFNNSFYIEAIKKVINEFYSCDLYRNAALTHKKTISEVILNSFKNQLTLLLLNKKDFIAKEWQKELEEVKNSFLNTKDPIVIESLAELVYAIHQLAKAPSLDQALSFFNSKPIKEIGALISKVMSNKNVKYTLNKIPEEDTDLHFIVDSETKIKVKKTIPILPQGNSSSDVSSAIEEGFEEIDNKASNQKTKPKKTQSANTVIEEEQVIKTKQDINANNYYIKLINLLPKIKKELAKLYDSSITNENRPDGKIHTYYDEKKGLINKIWRNLDIYKELEMDLKDDEKNIECLEELKSLIQSKLSELNSYKTELRKIPEILKESDVGIKNSNEPLRYIINESGLIVLNDEFQQEVKEALKSIDEHMSGLTTQLNKISINMVELESATNNDTLALIKKTIESINCINNKQKPIIIANPDDIVDLSTCIDKIIELEKKLYPELNNEAFNGKEMDKWSEFQENASKALNNYKLNKTGKASEKVSQYAQLSSLCKDNFKDNVNNSDFIDTIPGKTQFDSLKEQVETELTKEIFDFPWNYSIIFEDTKNTFWKDNFVKLKTLYSTEVAFYDDPLTYDPLKTDDQSIYDHKCFFKGNDEYKNLTLQLNMLESNIARINKENIETLSRLVNICHDEFANLSNENINIEDHKKAVKSLLTGLQELKIKTLTQEMKLQHTSIKSHTKKLLDKQSTFFSKKYIDFNDLLTGKKELLPGQSLISEYNALQDKYKQDSQYFSELDGLKFDETNQSEKLKTIWESNTCEFNKEIKALTDEVPQLPEVNAEIDFDFYQKLDKSRDLLRKFQKFGSEELSAEIADNYKKKNKDLEAKISNFSDQYKEKFVENCIKDLDDYSKARKNIYGLKDKFFAADEKKRALFIEGLKAKLTSYKENSNAADVVQYIEQNIKKFPGVNLQPLLHRMSLKIMSHSMVFPTESYRASPYAVFEELDAEHLTTQIAQIENNNIKTAIEQLMSSIKNLEDDSKKIAMEEPYASKASADLAQQLKSCLSKFIDINEKALNGKEKFEPENFKAFNDVFQNILHSKGDKISQSSHMHIGDIIIGVATLGLALIACLAITKIRENKAHLFFTPERNKIVKKIEGDVLEMQAIVEKSIANP